MDRKPRSKLNVQIYQEACEWFVELRSGDPDPEARREFDLWIRKSPEHMASYLEVAAIWDEGPSLDPSGAWDVDTLLAQAALEPDNVTAIGTPQRAVAAETSDSVQGHPRWRRRRWQLAASGFVLCAIAAATWWVYSDTTFRTGVGEQRFVVLDDGSTVDLDSRSRIRVHYSKLERRLDLLEGQALFHVARDSGRPFTVRAGGTLVRAVGTEFDVYRKPSGTVVTVVEGRVAILRDAEVSRAPTPPPAVALLSAGDQLTVDRRGAEQTAHPNVAGATAWRQRQLVFESASLTEVAEEFNRYNPRPLIVQNPAQFDFHISGVFSSTDPAPLIRFLQTRPGVTVTETTTEIRVAKTISGGEVSKH